MKFHECWESKSNPGLRAAHFSPWKSSAGAVSGPIEHWGFAETQALQGELRKTHCMHFWKKNLRIGTVENSLKLQFMWKTSNIRINHNITTFSWPVDHWHFRNRWKRLKKGNCAKESVEHFSSGGRALTSVDSKNSTTTSEVQATGGKGMDIMWNMLTSQRVITPGDGPLS